MYQTDRFAAIIMAIAMVFALPASIIGFLLGNGLITIMFAFITGFCLCYIMIHLFGAIQKANANPSLSEHCKPPGIMHQQARGRVKSKGGPYRLYGGPPYGIR